MALTTGRAIGLALAGMGVAVVLLLPPRPGRLERSGTYFRSAANQARLELRSAMQAVAARQARDSAAAAGSTDAPVVFFGRWDDSARSWLSARAAEQLGDLGGDARGRLRVVFARDSAFLPSPRVFFAFPSAPDAPCITIYGERDWASTPHRRPFRRVSDGVLGPCAYYAIFGRPGSGVEQWLREGGTALALTAPDRPPHAGRIPPRSSWVVSAIFGGETPRFADQRLATPLALESCIAGRVQACAEFVRGPRTGDRRLDRLGIREELLWAATTVEAAWLRDVLAAFGPERFAAFWTAEDDVDGAFATAFGVSVGEWTHAWIVGRFERPPPGGRLPARAGLSLLSAALLLGIAVVIAARRRAA